MPVTLACQGLPCPQPVLKCKTAVESENPELLIIVVDNEPARENVTRFLGTRGYEIVSEEKKDGEWTLTAARKDAPTLNAASSPASEISSEKEQGKTLVYIPDPVVGSGDDELGAKLMQNFVATLPEMGDELWRIILLNGGVRLAVSESPALESLKKMEQNGVSILVCGTCLEFFDLLEHKQVGETTNMLDVVTSFQLADKVIRA